MHFEEKEVCVEMCNRPLANRRSRCDPLSLRFSLNTNALFSVSDFVHTLSALGSNAAKGTTALRNPAVTARVMNTERSALAKDTEGSQLRTFSNFVMVSLSCAEKGASFVFRTFFFRLFFCAGSSFFLIPLQTNQLMLSVDIHGRHIC